MILNNFVVNVTYVVAFGRPAVSVHFHFFHVCLCQNEPVRKQAGKLMKILYRRDSILVPAFINALNKTAQQHVVRILGYEGLQTFVVLHTLLAPNN